MTENSQKTKPVDADIIFEVSWETCNKVGGINTVLATKAAQMIRHYHDGYFLVGPYFPEANKGQFDEKKPPADLKEVFDNLAREGAYCHFGRWLIDGEPKVILIDFKDRWKDVNRLKWELWDSYRVDSLNSAFDFDEPVVWGSAVALFLKAFREVFPAPKIVAHFHEWLAGAGLLFSKKMGTDVKTVFTTHATSLGRSLSSSNFDFYSSIDAIDADKAAYDHYIQAKHQIEKATALACTVFTTVSEITGVECEHFLSRMPDVLLPNGLDLTKFTSFEEVAMKHHVQRARIREFLFYYFFPYYVFDLKETLFYFIIGRYEYHTKGIDAFIESLGALNKQLKQEGSKKTIVAFFWIPAGVKEISQTLLENKSNFADLKQFVEENSQELVERFMYTLAAGKALKSTDVFDDKNLGLLDRKLKKKRREGTPPLCSHVLNAQDDAIIRAFGEAGLTNSKDDRVKVVFYPVYLTENDHLLNLDVQGAIQGCHLGVFPSYYEPWGYTPLEAAAEGVASVTSDLSGVGRFMSKMNRDPEHPGIFIINNFGKKESDVLKQLTGIMYDFSKLTRRERVENKIKARELVESCDWSNLVSNYIEAHNKALKQQQ